MARRRCHYCNAAPGTTRDHIVPRALGGPNSKWNIIEACSPCNFDKGHDWPSCPCGICDLARQMYLYAKERGLQPWPPPVFMDFAREHREHTQVLNHVLKKYRQRLWDIRVVRFERWEDATWIGKPHSHFDAAKRKVARGVLPPRAYDDVAEVWEWEKGTGWKV